MHGEGRVAAAPRSPSPCRQGAGPSSGLTPVLATGPRDTLRMRLEPSWVPSTV